MGIIAFSSGISLQWELLPFPQGHHCNGNYCLSFRNISAVGIIAFPLVISLQWELLPFPQDHHSSGNYCLSLPWCVGLCSPSWRMCFYQCHTKMWWCLGFFLSPRHIQDPASQRLTWNKPPKSVLVIKKIRDASLLQPFKELCVYLTEVRK